MKVTILYYFHLCMYNTLLLYCVIIDWQIDHVSCIAQFLGDGGQVTSSVYACVHTALRSEQSFGVLNVCFEATEAHTTRPSVRLRRSWTSHPRWNHGTASQQTPPNLRQQPDCSRGEDGGGRGDWCSYAHARTWVGAQAVLPYWHYQSL